MSRNPDNDRRAEFDEAVAKVPRVTSRRAYQQDLAESCPHIKPIGRVSIERRSRRGQKGVTPATVSHMLDDAYQALAMQISQFRRNAHSGAWSTTQASAFEKLVTSLVKLQETERKNVAAMDVQALSDAELQELAAQAAKVAVAGT